MATGDQEIQIQQRDIELLRDLFESRVMTLGHIAALHFGGHRVAAKKRVARLKRAFLIRERPRRRNEPAIHFLGQRAITVLNRRGYLVAYPHLTKTQLEKRLQVSSLTLQHELQVMDVKASFYTTIRRAPNLNLRLFSTWPKLNEFKAARSNGKIVPVQPDGFVLIEHGNGDRPYTFFFELDRGTKSQETLAEHAWCYRDYYRSGGFALRNGASRDHFEDFAFRVLFVFQSEERRNNAAERMLQLRIPIGAHSWLTTYEEVAADPLGSIWITPRDYAQVTTGTSYDPQRKRAIIGYSRDARREAMVAERLVKRSFLE